MMNIDIANQRSCFHCNQKICLKNVDLKRSVFGWQNREFCSLLCIGMHLEESLETCSHCKGALLPEITTKFCIRFGSHIEQFCSPSCLNDFKTANGFCTLCQERIFTYMLISEEKKFCSPFCVSRFNGKGINQKFFKNLNTCQICNVVGLHHYEFLKNGNSSFFCSRVCIAKYNVEVGQIKYVCQLCGCLLMSPEIFYYDEGKLQSFCCLQCANIFIIFNAKVIKCMVCKILKADINLIKRINSRRSEHFCSLGCLYKRPLETTSKEDRQLNTLITLDSDDEEENESHKSRPQEFLSLTCEEQIALLERFSSRLTKVVRDQSSCTEECSTSISCQTSVDSMDCSTQTDNSCSDRLKVVPFPAYVPTPLGCLNLNNPVPMVIPVPVPVPIPVPILTKNAISSNVLPKIAQGEKEEIKDRSSEVGDGGGSHSETPTVRKKLKTLDPSQLRAKYLSTKILKETRKEGEGKETNRSGCTSNEAFLKFLKTDEEKSDNGSGVVYGSGGEILATKSTKFVRKGTLLTRSESSLQTEKKYKSEKETKSKKHAFDKTHSDSGSVVNQVSRIEEGPLAPTEAVSGTGRKSKLEEESKKKILGGTDSPSSTSLPTSPCPPVSPSHSDSSGNVKSEIIEILDSLDIAIVDIDLVGSNSGIQSPSSLSAIIRNGNITVTTSTVNVYLGTEIWNKFESLRKGKGGSSTPKKSSRSTGRSAGEECEKSFSAKNNHEKNLYLSALLKDINSDESLDIHRKIYSLMCVQKHLRTSEGVDSIFTNICFQRFSKDLYGMIKSHFNEHSSYKAFIDSSQKFPVFRIKEEFLWNCNQLGTTSPSVLLFTIFYLNTKNFLLNSVEEHENVKFKKFVRLTSSCSLQDGTPYKRRTLRYIYPRESSLRKILSSSYKDVIGGQMSLRCHIKLYDFYITKCNPGALASGSFYLTPILGTAMDSKTWFSIRKLSSEMIQNMFYLTLLVDEIQTTLQKVMR